MSKSDPSRCAGVVATACTQGKRRQHGKPHGVVGRGDQPKAGDGRKGRCGVAERFVVPMKPGNAGGGKGPQDKMGMPSGEAREIGETLANSQNVRDLQIVPDAEVKGEPRATLREGDARHGRHRRLLAGGSDTNSHLEDTAPGAGSRRLWMTFRVRRCESCPRAGCGKSARPVR